MMSFMLFKQKEKKELENIQKIVLEKPKLEKSSVVENERHEFAPLFVKIDKYKEVLDLLAELRSAIVMIKNSVVIQKEIENLANENRDLVESSIEKLDKKISLIDSEFVRPHGYKKEIPDTRDAKNVDGVVNSLKTQIQDLKTELEQIS